MREIKIITTTDKKDVPELIASCAICGMPAKYLIETAGGNVPVCEQHKPKE